MGWLYIYRLVSLVAAFICAAIVLGLAASSRSAAKRFFDIATGYITAGILAGGLTLLVIPILIACDFITGGLPILIEAPALSVLWILFIITGGLTFSDANFSKYLQPYTCDDLKGLIVPEGITICKDSHPLGVTAFVAAFILAMYSITLAVVAFSKSILQQSVKKSEV